MLDKLFFIWKQRTIINVLSKREISTRYKGSYFGVIWSFITPLLMLFVYTFFFGVIFDVKWSNMGDSKIDYALILFCGLITYNIFSEVVGRSPSIILANTNYVKKVIFPLEIFPITILNSALIHFLASLVILIIGNSLFGQLGWQIIFLPLVILPILLTTLGLSWILSSLGVYIRDIQQVIGVAIQAILFMSPIFYPIELIPNSLKFILYINPIAFVPENMRRIILWGQLPDWNTLVFGLIYSCLIAVIGYLWFMKTKGGFADVI